MPFTYRPFDPDRDYPSMAETFNAIKSAAEPPRTIEEERDWDMTMMRPDAPHLKICVEDNHGHMIGFVRLAHMLGRPETALHLTLRIDPQFWHQGVGSELFNQILPFAHDQHAQRIFIRIGDHLPESRPFAERRGFVLDRHIFNSLLDVATFAETPFAGVVDSAIGSGLRFASLADLGDTPENRHRLHDILLLTSEDIPGDNNFDMRDFDKFERMFFPTDHALPDATIIALDGDQWAGFATLGYQSPEMLGHFMTGVDRRYRGRKVALALKLLNIRYAKQNQIKHLMANNDSLNAPMLAINVKLGYRRLPGSYLMIKTLEG